MAENETPWTLDKMREIALDNVNKHLGDVATGDDTAEVLYNETYTLAHDALVNAGVDMAKAREVAHAVAYEMFPGEDGEADY